MLPFLSLLPPVTVSPLTSYPNGYGYRRARRIPGAAILGSEALTGCQLWFDRTDAAFKDTAHGGRVQSSAGWDIRFETAAGVRIPHELEVYDPATGRRAGWLAPPSLPAGQDFDLYEYYGNAAVAAAEADAAACWASSFAAWRMPDGVDMSGQGRSLTVSGVTSGTITGLDSGAGIPAGIFAAASYMELAAPAWFGGTSEWTLAGLLLPGSLPNSASWTRFGGTVVGSARHATWFDPAPGAAPGLSNCWAGGYKLSDANNPQLFQPSGSAVAAALQHLAYVARSGVAPSWYRNGLLSPATLVGTVATGSIDIQNGDVFRLGANGGSNPEAVRGKYGRLVLWRQAKSAAFLWLHYLSLLDPDAVMSISDEDAATDPDHAPILAGSFASCAAGSSIDLPLLDHASDPDGTAMAPVVETSPAQGSASAQDSGAVRYSAGSGASGADRFTASANSGGKKALAAVRVSITGGGGGGGDPGAELPTPARTAFVGNQAGDYSSLAAFYAAYNPDTMAGTHLRIRAGMGPQAGINWQKPGRQDAPLVVRADVTPAKNSAGAWVMPRVNGISLNAADVILWGLDQGSAAIGVTGARCRILRCLFDGYQGGSDSIGQWISVAAPDVLVGYVEMRNGLGRWISVNAEKAPRARLFRGYLHDGTPSNAGNTHEVIQVGLQASHRLISAQAIVEAMLISGIFVGGKPSEEECISNKSSNNLYRFNTLLNCAHLENRHGRRNRYLGNWIEGPSSGLRIMDADHTLLGNYVRGDGLELWAGNCTPDAYVNGKFPSSWNAVAVGNDAPLAVGASYGSQSPVLAAQDALIEKNTGLVTLKKQTGAIQHATTAYAYPTPVKLAAAEVGIGAAWRGYPS